MPDPDGTIRNGHRCSSVGTTPAVLSVTPVCPRGDLNSRFREDTEGHTRASDLAIDLLHRASRPSADRIRVHPDSPAAASRITSRAALPPVHPCPLNIAAPPRRECARRGLDPIPPPNREDRTMTETVGRAQAQPPRALGGIIEDARRATCGHCWADGPAWACSFSGTEFAAAERHGTASSGAACPALSFSCTGVVLPTAPPARSQVHARGGHTDHGNGRRPPAGELCRRDFALRGTPPGMGTGPVMTVTPIT